MKWRRKHPRAERHLGESMGTLVYDELIVPIVEIRLRDSFIEFIGKLTGPVDAFNGRGVRVFSPEGGLIFNAPEIGVEWDAVSEDGHLWVYQTYETVDHFARCGGTYR